MKIVYHSAPQLKTLASRPITRQFGSAVGVYFHLQSPKLTDAYHEKAKRLFDKTDKANIAKLWEAYENTQFFGNMTPAYRDSIKVEIQMYLSALLGHMDAEGTGMHRDILHGKLNRAAKFTMPVAGVDTRMEAAGLLWRDTKEDSPHKDFMVINETFIDHMLHYLDTGKKKEA